MVVVHTVRMFLFTIDPVGKLGKKLLPSQTFLEMLVTDVVFPDVFYRIRTNAFSTSTSGAA